MHTTVSTSTTAPAPAETLMGDTAGEYPVSGPSPTLFDPLPAKLRRRACATSRAAALAVTPRTGTQRWRVWSAIVAAGAEGLTDEQVQDQLGMKNNTECPRRLELVEGGWVVDSGRTRATRSGCAAAVWVASSPRGAVA